MPAAINASVYLMVGVPYLVLGVVGFLVYRGVKKNAEFLAIQPSPGALGEPPETPV